MQPVNRMISKKFLSKNLVIRHYLDELKRCESSLQMPIQNLKIFAYREAITEQTIVKFLTLSFAINCDASNGPHSAANSHNPVQQFYNAVMTRFMSRMVQQLLCE